MKKCSSRKIVVVVMVVVRMGGLLLVSRAPTALIGQYMKSKQLPLIGKLICLAILSVKSIYKFSEMYVL